VGGSEDFDNEGLSLRVAFSVGPASGLRALIRDRTCRRNGGFDRCLFRPGHRLELVDAAIRHQRQKQVTILDDVGPDEVPIL
jgi:hypothetical protein